MVGIEPVKPGGVAMAQMLCGGCQQPIQADDKFCRDCGYSRKKCPACRKKLSSSTAGKYCPYCGVARDGQQVIRTSPVASRAWGIGSFVKNFAAPVIVVIIGALILAQPTIRRSDAQTFFGDYFTKVTHGKQQRDQLYAQELTTSFRQFNPEGSFDGFWKQVDHVKIHKVYAAPGNASEFTVSFTIYYKPGTQMYRQTDGSELDRANYWIICTGFLGNLAGRFPFIGCLEDDLKFDNQQKASLLSGNS
jgi:hypothetical protein